MHSSNSAPCSRPRHSYIHIAPCPYVHYFQRCYLHSSQQVAAVAPLFHKVKQGPCPAASASGQRAHVYGSGASTSFVDKTDTGNSERMPLYAAEPLVPPSDQLEASVSISRDARLDPDLEEASTSKTAAITSRSSKISNKHGSSPSSYATQPIIFAKGSKAQSASKIPAHPNQVPATTQTPTLQPRTEADSPKHKAKLTGELSSYGAAAQYLQGPTIMVAKPLPRVLFLHTGGTLGMDVQQAFEETDSHVLRPKEGAANSSYQEGLGPGQMLSDLFDQVPELAKFANLDLAVLFNKDSSRVGPSDWIAIAQELDRNRSKYDAFIVVHGTDTMAYTAAALSLLLTGFRKPIIMTGSQLPLSAPRSDARQNLVDSLQCATAAFSPPHVSLQEVAICFGGRLMRGNRTQKVNSGSYQAFDSLAYPRLATLGIDVDWNERVLLRVEGAYKPRFKLDPRVIRIPIVPGSDPRTAYGDVYGRGVRGVVLEVFGVGNMPDLPEAGWLPWLKDQTDKGLQVYLGSQCAAGPLAPALYAAGQLAAQLGVEAGPHMTPECAAVKMMFCLSHPDLALGVPLAGEL